MKLKLLLFIMVLLSSAFPLAAYAQNSQTQILIATPYETRQDLDFLSAQSIHPLDTIESPDLEKSLFISIVTSAQNTAIEKAGYKPKLVDTNAGQIDQYYLVESELGKPFPSNTGLELVYPFTSELTLVKVPAGKYLEDYRTGDLVRMFVKQYAFDMVLPSISPEASVSPTVVFSAPVATQNKQGLNYILLIIGVIFLIATVVLSVYFRRKKKLEVNSLPAENNETQGL